MVCKGRIKAKCTRLYLNASRSEMIFRVLCGESATKNKSTNLKKWKFKDSSLQDKTGSMVSIPRDCRCYIGVLFWHVGVRYISPTVPNS